MSLSSRRRQDGTWGHTATIRVKRDGVIVHQESQTFDRKQAAIDWKAKRKAELRQPGALDRPDDPTLAEVITQYNTDKLKAHGKTKDQVLATISAGRLGKMRCSQITSPVLVAWVRDDLKGQPSTRGNYISHLASIFLVARPAWGYPLDKQAMDDAKVVLNKLGLIAKSNERDRRPTLAELDKILTYFQVIEKKRPSSIPMTRIIPFAIFSTRRQEEITRIRRSDLDRSVPGDETVVVRDMKHPGEKIGNDVAVHLVPEALSCIDAQPDRGDTIFPYNAESISTAFTRACKFLGIEDLHFHDLRHDGISRLFEMGWLIPKVATVSGHRSWQSLKRYTHIRQTGDKYAGWKWLPKSEVRPLA